MDDVLTCSRPRESLHDFEKFAFDKIVSRSLEGKECGVEGIFPFSLRIFSVDALPTPRKVPPEVCSIYNSS